VLVGVMAMLAGRVGEFMRIADGVRGRVERAEHVRVAAMALQGQALHLQESLETINDRAALLRAKRGGDHSLVDRLDGPDGMSMTADFDEKDKSRTPG
jgi:hypothetical protein